MATTDDPARAGCVSTLSLSQHWLFSLQTSDARASCCMPQETQLPVFCVPGRSARPVDFEESAQFGAVPSPLRFLLVVGSGRTCPHDFRFLGDALLREVLAATSEQSVSIDRSIGFSPMLGGQSSTGDKAHHQASVNLLMTSPRSTLTKSPSYVPTAECLTRWRMTRPHGLQN
ncbi:hypothetical protein VFPBJ_11656 [Purpureocillium lilacinum]|uniref:Uncharacterized protein n=1 Tax=Purpureocillium lilacinum TaxID=33203 RepID=A0A179F0U4_PURLI|nr:hypothetical protein VFPBJ_11656 [Purpureocillium lilacinum]